LIVKTISSSARRWCGLLVLLWVGSLLAHAEIPNPFPAGELHEFTLPNGLRLVVKEDHSLPITAMVVTVHGGASVDGNTPGAGHYCEHLVLQGTRHYPGRLAPQDALERAGGVSEATTTRDMTRFQATVVSSQVRLLVDVLADVVGAPTLDEDNFDHERPTILAEIQQEADSPLFALLNAGYAASYPTHPYRLRPSGTIEDILKLHVDDVRAYYRRWYVPNNLSVVLVGDITAPRALELVTRAFGAAKSTAVPDWPDMDPTPAKTVSGHYPTAQPDTYQLLVFPAPAYSDFSATVATDVLMSLLTDGNEALLPARWIRDGISVTNFGAEFVSARQPGRIMLWAETPPAAAEKLKRSTLALLAELAAGNIPAAGLAAAKQRLGTHLLLDNETYSQQAVTLAFYEGLGGMQPISRYLPSVLALTSAQLQAGVPTKPLAWITMGQRPEGGE